MKKLIASFCVAFMLVPAVGLAQTDQLCQGSGGTMVDGSCVPKEGKRLAGQEGYFNAIVNVLLYVVGAVSVIVLIIGGLTYVTSTGDPARIKRAKDTILYAVIGIIVAILAFAIVNFVIGRL